MMLYPYCPYCTAAYTRLDTSQQTCMACLKTVYHHSKPTASTLIIQDDKVLLGKRSIEPFLGMWDVIGGFLHYGESPEAGAIREAKEETGLDIEIIQYLGTVMDVYGEVGEATMNIGYLARVLDGTLAPDDDISAVAWFSKDELPEQIAFHNGQQFLARWCAL